MLRKYFFVLVMLGFASSVYATQPFVENLTVQHPQQSIATPTWTTVLDSTSTVNVPAGIAVITWTTTALGISIARPFIGDERMADNEAPFLGLGSGATTHTWSVPILAGEITVGLEILQFETNQAGVGGFGGSMSWTLVVYPDEPAPAVPAVGSMGLGLMVIVLLGAGAVIMRRRIEV